MSRFIDKLKQRVAPQPLGFRTTQPSPAKPKLQLVASLSWESVEPLVKHTAGADAALLPISKTRSAAKTLKGMTQAVPDIPCGLWLQDSSLAVTNQVIKAGADFIVFPAKTPLVVLQTEETGKILEIETSMGEGLVRAANELPVDAVLIAGENKEGSCLTWQDLLLFRRLADLLVKPLLVLIPVKVTAEELQALWAAGVRGVVTEITAEQPQERLKELRQVIDNLTLPPPRREQKVEPRLPHVPEANIVATEEEEEEEDE